MSGVNTTVHKASGICSVCDRVCKLLLRNGTVHKHGFGSTSQACAGSYRLPRPNAIPTSVARAQHAQPLPATTLAAPPSPLSAPGATQTIQLTQAATDGLPNSFATVVSDRPFDHPANAKPLIKIIPKNSRVSCGEILSKILSDIVTEPSRVHRWNDLLHVGAELLGKPLRGGKRHNLGNIINKRAANYDDKTKSRNNNNYSTCTNSDKHHKDNLLAAAVTSKIEDGNLRAAIRLICSEDAVAPYDDDTLHALRSKHPGSPPDRDHIDPPVGVQCLQITAEDVREAIRSFPAGSSGGPDGFTPRHLQDLISGQHVADGLLQNLTAFVNLMLRGDVPEAVKPIIFGGRLIALQKKNGGVRPIAIGYVWRRLSGKCASKYATLKLAPLLSPLQLGVGVPNGCEAAVHAARRFVETLQGDRAFIKLDFANAFNSLRRDCVLSAVASEIPELFDFCAASYGSSSFLKFGVDTIFSDEGVQQGDPLGPLLFCITLHPLLEGLLSDLRIGYLDDISLGGDGVDLALDLKRIIEEGKRIGLQLNVGKCEIIKSRDFIDRAIFQDFVHVEQTNACLLGAPLSNGPAMDSCLSIRCEDLSRAIERLDLLTSHDALTILRSALSTPKLMYTLRASPCSDHGGLEIFDGILRSGLSKILNVDITDVGWVQASLPVREGGLGIRSAALLAPSAFLASAASTQLLQSQILHACNLGTDVAVTQTISVWQARYQADEPDQESVHRQSSWDKAAIDHAWSSNLVW